jgi:tetratricopeptide (TPR) repeat protein
MKKTYLVWCLAAVIVMVAFVGSFAATPVEQVDEFYAQRKDMANVKLGVSYVDTQLALNDKNYDMLWRQARFYHFMGDRAVGKERVANFEKGKAFAEKAVDQNDAGFDGHYWLAACIGSVGIEKGILSSLFMVSPMKKELEACIKINPLHAATRYVYARLLWQVPGFAGGNLKKALEEAKLAITYDPNVIAHWLNYGQIAAANKDYKTARTALEKAISMPDDPEDPFGSQQDRDEAAVELKKIEGK